MKRLTVYKDADLEMLLSLNPFVLVWMSHDGLKSAWKASTHTKKSEENHPRVVKTVTLFSLNKRNLFFFISFMYFGAVAWREACWMGSYWSFLLTHRCSVVQSACLWTWRTYLKFWAWTAHLYLKLKTGYGAWKKVIISNCRECFLCSLFPCVSFQSLWSGYDIIYICQPRLPYF